MFTGLVEEVGVVRRRSKAGASARLVVATSLGPLTLGESIAVSGVCLTVDRIAGGAHPGFEADMSAETLARTTLGALSPGDGVHLERATPAGGRLGGHVVLGHVDGFGAVASRKAVGDSVRLAIRAPAELARYLAPKGSIAIDGVSLTLNTLSDAASGTTFDVMLVPHTLRHTRLGALSAGARVNLEVDVLARYVARQLELGGAAAASSGGPGGPGEAHVEQRDARLLAKLRAHGY